MKRAVSLGTVTFSYNSLFISEEFTPSNILTESTLSAAGTDIVFLAEHITPSITLLSKEHGWITDSQREDILAMYSDISATYTLTYSDATTDQVRFKWETPPTFTEIREGSSKYTATIPLAKI